MNENHEAREKQELTSARHIKWPAWPSKKKTVSPDQRQRAEKQDPIEDRKNHFSPAFDEQDAEPDGELIQPFHHEEDDPNSVEIDPFHINSGDRPYDPPHSE
ncbi:hypothetical protein NIE88_10500 [Sporolactobacillus shoreicorticis]|uniref:Uncharacterized protein n=1 Tax=Sporolactobacillus shoreicorticis TaxID=1923877 RepID=A0ABW5S6A3_9BACL|nr:hypothetical protein [Sporolactobacillus shoreicorticis]MCO7126205.1 hypothetical protein [Sporolactobacillus shoreicorticis]